MRVVWVQVENAEVETRRELMLVGRSGAAWAAGGTTYYPLRTTSRPPKVSVASWWAPFPNVTGT